IRGISFSSVLLLDTTILIDSDQFSSLFDRMGFTPNCSHNQLLYFISRSMLTVRSSATTKYGYLFVVAMKKLPSASKSPAKYLISVSVIIYPLGMKSFSLVRLSPSKLFSGKPAMITYGKIHQAEAHRADSVE